MNITQEGHVDKLDYGWWESKRGHIFLPRTLGQKNNFVLTPEELAHYDMYLTDLAAKVEAEQVRVGFTMQCFRQARMPMWAQRTVPTCFTIAHVLEHLVLLAKGKLELMHILNYIAKARVDEQRSAAKTDESARSTDP